MGAAAHAMVVDGPYTTCGLDGNKATNWILMHSTAPLGDPLAIKHDPRNPVLLRRKVLTTSQSNTLSRFGTLPTTDSMSII